MEKSKIGWLNGGNTFNPWIGCAKVSEACANCYARSEMVPPSRGDAKRKVVLR